MAIVDNIIMQVSVESKSKWPGPQYTLKFGFLLLAVISVIFNAWKRRKQQVIMTKKKDNLMFCEFSE